ncbi:MAG: hypothetical protein RLZZ179_1392 [Verrucomicrobiota bacterium]|jgi:hypothetical protein
MNSNAIVRIFATFALLFAALWVAFDIFTSGGNAVARSYMYMMVASGVYGLLNPRKAFYVLLFLTAYLDYFKRLMIFDSGLSRLDLYYVLGIAPCTLVGIAVSVIYQQFIGRTVPRPGQLLLTFVSVGASALLLVLSLTGNRGGFRSLGDGVNAAIYLLLLFTVPALFQTPGELKKLLKACIIIYIPAIIYLLIHFIRGSVFDWEMDYLKSGLTGEIRILMERQFRFFGTMNSAANASSVFGLMLALICSGVWKYRNDPPYERQSNPVSRFLLIIPIGVAMYATFSRMGWVSCVVAIVAVWFFKRRFLTVAGYALSLAAVVTIVLASPYLLRHKILNKISEDIYSQKRTDEWSQTTNISTLNDRLEGFNALVTNSKVWTPLGLRFSSYNEKAVLSQVESHDLFTDTLLRYGYVPIFVALGVAGWLLIRMHRFIFEEPPGLVRDMAAGCLAAALSVTAGGLANGAQLSTYPVNFFIWFMFSVVGALMMYRREEEELARLAIPEREPEAARPEPVARRPRPAGMGAPARV